MLIRDAMARPVFTVSPDDSIARAGRIMWQQRVHQLPVVDESGAVVGIVTDRDLRSSKGSPKSMLETPVRNIMTSDPIRLGPDSPIEEATRLLFENRFGALPIVDADQRVVGIVTRNDILNVLMTILGMKEPGSRIEVELCQGPQSITRAFAALESLSAPIISAIVSHSPADERCRTLYLRLGTIDAGPARQALGDAGFRVRDPR